MVLPLIILGLLSYSVYQFFGAMACFGYAGVILVAAPLIAARDVRDWWRFRKQRAEQREREANMLDQVERVINEYCARNVDKLDVDENGIPYL